MTFLSLTMTYLSLTMTYLSLTMTYLSQNNANYDLFIVVLGSDKIDFYLKK